MKCNQICKYNTSEGCVAKKRNGVCPLLNVSKAETTEQLVETKDVLLRDNQFYEVVIADDNIFVICPVTYDAEEESEIVNYEKAEIYANQLSVNTLEELRFKKTQIEKCPYCGEAWLYASDGDYYSGYESNGFKISCACGFAWSKTDWKTTKDEAIKTWNDIMMKKGGEEQNAKQIHTNPLHRTRTARNNRSGEEREIACGTVFKAVGMGENERECE